MIKTDTLAAVGLVVFVSLAGCSGGNNGGSGGRGATGNAGGAGPGGRGGAGAAGTVGNDGGGPGTGAAGAGAGGVAGTGLGGSGDVAGTTGTAGTGGGGSDGGAGTTGTAGRGGSAGSAGTTGTAGRGGSAGSAATGGAGTGSGGAGTTGAAGAGAGGAGGCRASVSGVVYDPAGKLPIYNAIVYVPTAPLDPLPAAASCDRCGARPSGNPATIALSDAQGRFRLEGVPTGNNVPLVIQIGKWRRQVTIPTVAACADTALTNVELTRLPRTQAEGNLPRIAVATGGSDRLECLLRRIGIADTEFTTDAGAGRVHLYAGYRGVDSFAAGGTFTPADTLWASPTKLAGYDMLVMACEGDESVGESRPQASVDNVAAYVGAGGRLLLSHYHRLWLERSPALSGAATYTGGAISPPSHAVMTVNQTFPKGSALAQWLAAPSVSASSTLGQLVVDGAEASIRTVTPPTTEWLVFPPIPNMPTSARTVNYMTFNAPLANPPAQQCGRVGLADMHVSYASPVTMAPFPTACSTTDMSPQEKAVEFFFFDVGGCLQPDSAAPAAP